MNLVGKIFIVLIFVMSLVWMWSSVTVYATHTNWREYVENDEDGLKVQVQRAKERNTELDDQRQKLEVALNTEKAGKRQALTKLQSRNDELERQRTEQEKMLADRVTEVSKANAELKAAHEQEKVLRDEVIALREEIKQAQKDRDDNFDLVVKRTDALHQAANLYRALNARTVTLTEDLAKATEVLRIHGLKAEPAIYSGIAPFVEGVVLDVGSEGKTIEISIGADDGLMKGHFVEVTRDGGGWLGRVQVMQTSPDKAVCKVLKEFLQRPIQRNDRVTTKLKAD